MKYIRQLYQYRAIILNLSVSDWKKEYTETLFGLVWAIFKPIVLISTFYFVFTYGLKAGGDVNGHPFILWMLAGSVPWFFLSECLGKAAGTFQSYSVLITTIKFPVMALPLIQILSRFYTHLIVFGLLVVVFLVNGYFPSIYWLNLIYFMAMGLLLMTAISMILSAIGVLIKDTDQIMQAVIMPLYWLTPIMWPLTNLSEQMQLVMMLVNPFIYIIEGFRDSLLYETWFWENIWYDIWFWLVLAVLFLIGIRLQKFMRPIMADVI